MLYSNSALNEKASKLAPLKFFTSQVTNNYDIQIYKFQINILIPIYDFQF